MQSSHEYQILRQNQSSTKNIENSRASFRYEYHMQTTLVHIIIVFGSSFEQSD